MDGQVVGFLGEGRDNFQSYSHVQDDEGIALSVEEAQAEETQNGVEPSLRIKDSIRTQ